MADDDLYTKMLDAAGYVPPQSLNEDAPQADGEGRKLFAKMLVAGGRPEWSDPNIPAEKRVADFARTHAHAQDISGGSDEKRVFGRPYSFNAEAEGKAEADALAKAKRLFPDVDESAIKQQFQLERARARQAGQGEDTLEYVARSVMPLRSIGNANRTDQYRRALAAFNDGKATPEQHEVIARYERLQQIEGSEDTLAATGRAVAGVPGMLAEGYVGGRLIMGPAGRAMGLSKAAPAPLLNAGETVAAKGLLPAAGRLGVQTAAMPSMYLERGATNQLERPDDSTFRSYAPAFGMGLVQTAVLGQLSGRFSNVPTLGGRLGARTGLGMAEMQGADVGLTAFDRAVKEETGKTLGMDTKWGLAGKFVRGDDDRWKEAVVQTATFGAFATLHGHSPEAIRDAFKSVVNRAAGRGRSREAVARDLTDAVKPVQDYLAETKVPDPATLDKIVADAPEATRPYVQAVVDTLAPLPPEVAKQTRVVDAAGKPIRVYHGTDKTFARPDPSLGHEMSHDYGPGYYVATDPAHAAGFVYGDKPGEQIRFEHLDVRKPFYADAPLTAAEADALLAKAYGKEVPEFLSFAKNAEPIASFAKPPGHAGLTGKDVIDRATDLMTPKEFIAGMQKLGYDGVFGGYGLGDRKTPLNLKELEKHPASDFQQIVVWDPKQVYKPWGAEKEQPAPFDPPVEATPEPKKNTDDLFAGLSKEQVAEIAAGVGLTPGQLRKKAGEPWVKQVVEAATGAESSKKAPSLPEVAPERVAAAGKAPDAPERAPEPGDHGPLPKVLEKAFPGAEVKDGGELGLILAGADHNVNVRYIPEGNRAEINFNRQSDGSGKDATAVKKYSGSLSPGSVAMARDVVRVAKALKAAGVGVEFSAEPSRAAMNRRLLEKAGFKLVSEGGPPEMRRMAFDPVLQSPKPGPPHPPPPRVLAKPRQLVEPVEPEGPKRVPVMAPPEKPPSPEQAFDAAAKKAGLMSFERHVLRERLKPEARSHQKIAGDPEMRKPDGTPYTRQQVSNIEKGAREKLVKAGVDLAGFDPSKSVAKGVHEPDALDRKLKAVGDGKLVSIEELKHDPAEVARRAAGEFQKQEQRAAKLKALEDSLIKELEDAQRTGKPLTPEREAFFERELTRLNSEGAEAGRVPDGEPRPAGPARDQAGEAQGQAPAEVKDAAVEKSRRKAALAEKKRIRAENDLTRNPEGLPEELLPPKNFRGDSWAEVEGAMRHFGAKTFGQWIRDSGGINPDSMSAGERAKWEDAGMQELFKDRRGRNQSKGGSGIDSRADTKGKLSLDGVANSFSINDPQFGQMLHVKGSEHASEALLEAARTHRVWGESYQWEAYQQKLRDFRDKKEHDERLREQGIDPEAAPKKAELTEADLERIEREPVDEFGAEDFAFGANEGREASFAEDAAARMLADQIKAAPKTITAMKNASPPQGPDSPTIRERARAWVSGVRSFFRELGGAMAPRTTARSEAAGDSLARFVGADQYGKELTPVLVDKVFPAKDLGDGRTQKVADSFMVHVGATVVETRLRHMRQAFLDKSKELLAEADKLKDPEAQRLKRNEAFQWEKDAAAVKSIVGQPLESGGDVLRNPFMSEADYQHALKDPEIKAAIGRYKEHVVPIIEANYRKSQGLDPHEEIESLTQIPGMPVNMRAWRPGDAKTAGMVSFGGKAGNLLAPRQNKLGFSYQAKGNAQGYHLNLGDVIENSISRSTELAAKAEMYRVLEGEGLAKWAKPGQAPEGWGHQLEVKPPKGTQAAGKDEVRLYFKDADVHAEVRKALNTDLPFGQTLPVVTNLLNKATLASLGEVTSHSKNLLTMAFKPGVSLVGFVKNVVGVVRDRPEIRDRIVELARIGAVKPKGFEAQAHQLGSKYNPLTWTGKFLDVIDRAMRLTADQGFSRLALREGFKATEGKRRDFVNQLGQYNRRAQNRVVRLLRDTGLGPFATAGSNYWMQGLRSLYGGHGVQGLGWKTDLKLRAVMLSKIASFAALVPIINFTAWGRVDGDDETPIGAVKVGKDAKGKTQYLDLLALTGFTRGMRETGLLAWAEGQRSGAKKAGATTADTIDAMRKDVQHGVTHPAMGPLPSFAHTALTGENSIGMNVAGRPETDAQLKKQGKPLESRESQSSLDAKAAVIHANPLIAAFMALAHLDPRAKETTTQEEVFRQMGPFGLKTRGQAPGAPRREMTIPVKAAAQQKAAQRK